MPSGPAELHQKWCDKDPHGFGDLAAMAHLRKQGLILTDGWCWKAPAHYEPDEEAKSAISYLMLEWDFGGLI